ncbi:ninja-family protein AFP3-like [Iris pallida]|uniref:Ninja-family protein AFP3-like n=1 Tax=Iris pallida TaxID=29817 RepID=A0AAX6EFG1_IRIPA|nr:ninja-family protein AFP3-like [Iris pallida]KAJ6815471.1 ninja-family protein AFP3-like [Iris pallida]
MGRASPLPPEEPELLPRAAAVADRLLPGGHGHPPKSSAAAVDAVLATLFLLSDLFLFASILFRLCSSFLFL